MSRPGDRETENRRYSMRHSRRLTRRDFVRAGTTVVGALLVTGRGAHAQTSGFAAKPLLQSTVERDESKEAVLLAITIAPGGSSGRHTHPGDCYGTVVEGTVELRVEGREPRTVSTGDAWHNARGVVHELRNVDPAPARVVNTLVVDRGKPRMQAVPHQ
jgi:quercetin dioxygenase-like cupin family protein